MCRACSPENKPMSEFNTDSSNEPPDSLYWIYREKEKQEKSPDETVVLGFISCPTFLDPSWYNRG